MTYAFRTTFGEDIFQAKYAHRGCETWPLLAETLANDVCGSYMPAGDVWQVAQIIREMKFIPAGRYLYYAGRPRKFFNNCCCGIVEDTREGWAETMGNTTAALMAGAGVGIYYGKLRPRGSYLRSTGGEASGPIPLMLAVNELARHVKQGGSRRSAVWAGLPWDHSDRDEFITAKQWTVEQQLAKSRDFNSPAPLDMTNISVCFNDDFLDHPDLELLERLTSAMCVDGEPGMAFNFGRQSGEVGRNACTEFVSSTDGDFCNLGALNLARIESLDELRWVTRLAAQFLFCGSLRSELPFKKAYDVRYRHRKIGLGLMGVHEWQLQRGYCYSMPPELHAWADTYHMESKAGADEIAFRLGYDPVERYRAIAPTGTISILAGTSSGIEPIFAPAMKRRYLVNGNRWESRYLIDPTAEAIGRDLGVDLDSIETAYLLAEDPERRIKFQADVQDYVDMAISSTINLPEWGSPWNNEDTVPKLARLLLKYMPRLRGITAYPNNGRAGQVLTAVPYSEAKRNLQVIYDEQEAMDHQCKSGVCSM